MQLSVTTNADLVRMGLQNLALEVPKIGRNQIWQAMQRAQAKMRIYPAERKDQKYRRTYYLRKNWKIGKASGAMAGYTIQNDTPYAPYVVGDAYGQRQAWMHISTDQGKRWNLVRDVIEDEVKTLPEAITDELRMVARRYKVGA